jgi:hypothetical protein
MDEDRLTPRLGRLIDAAKAAAARARAEAGTSSEGAPVTAGGWAVLGEDGKVYTGPRLDGALGAVQRSGTSPEAAAFAAVGESGDTLLPPRDWRRGVAGVDPHLPVAVKHLGRWVVVTLEEIRDA